MAEEKDIIKEEISLEKSLIKILHNNIYQQKVILSDLKAIGSRDVNFRICNVLLSAEL